MNFLKKFNCVWIRKNNESDLLLFASLNFSVFNFIDCCTFIMLYSVIIDIRRVNFLLTSFSWSTRTSSFFISSRALRSWWRFSSILYTTALTSSLSIPMRRNWSAFLTVASSTSASSAVVSTSSLAYASASWLTNTGASASAVSVSITTSSVAAFSVVFSASASWWTPTRIRTWSRPWRPTWIWATGAISLLVTTLAALVASAFLSHSVTTVTSASLSALVGPIKIISFSCQSNIKKGGKSWRMKKIKHFLTLQPASHDLCDHALNYSCKPSCFSMTSKSL